MSKKGRRYENELANEVHEQTPDVCQIWPAGYSGNNAFPSPDLIAVTSRGAAALELKNWGTDDRSLAASDLRQLLRVQKSFLDVALLIDFSNREPLLVEPAAPSLDAFETEGGPDVIENFKTNVPDAFEPRVTDGPEDEDGALRLSYPSLDDWPSAQAGDDATTKVASWLGYPL